MQQITQVACGDQYTNATTLSEVFNSSGGYFTIQDNDAYVELQYGGLGQFYWTNEAPVPVGNGILQAGTTGVRFRNLTPGLAATVTAALYAEAEPALIITAGGLATPSTGMTITGAVNSTGTVAWGSGFSVAHPSTGVYNVTFTTAFGATPTPVATGGAGNPGVSITNIATTGMTVNTFNTTSGAASDAMFTFIVEATV